MKTNIIYQGDALTKLKELPSESISCVMTSPPYWALRDYGIDVETIWDAKEGCEHEWGEQIPYAKRDDRTPDEKKAQGAVVGNSINSENFAKGNSGNFCSKCGAWKGQLGLEPTFDLYIKHLCDIFDEAKRVLRKDGTAWINLGDTYYSVSGGKFMNDNLGNKDRNELKGLSHAKELEQKNLCNIPARFSIEMQNRGWILRNVIIWNKPNCMPSSVKDRFTVDFEYLFFFVKSKKYWFETQREGNNISYMDNSRVRDVIKNRIKYSGTRAGEEEIENYDPKQYECIGRNKRAVWRICPRPFKEAHFATYPEELCETPIRAGCPEFICKKCGKAREKILEPTEEYQKVLDSIKGLPSGNLTEGYQHYKNNTKAMCADYKCIGYSDCNCQAGFESGIVLDMFMGAGTTGLVALKQNKRFIGIELNKNYCDIAYKRLKPYLDQTKLL